MLITTEQLETVLATRAKVHKVRWLPRSGMTVGKHIFVTKDSTKLLYHEAAHVLQYEDEGFFSFLTQYFSQYLYGLASLRSHEQAYRSISFEMQARAAANKAMEEM